MNALAVSALKSPNGWVQSSGPAQKSASDGAFDALMSESLGTQVPVPVQVDTASAWRIPDLVGFANPDSPSTPQASDAASAPLDAPSSLVNGSQTSGSNTTLKTGLTTVPGVWPVALPGFGLVPSTNLASSLPGVALSAETTTAAEQQSTTPTETAPPASEEPPVASGLVEHPEPNITDSKTTEPKTTEPKVTGHMPKVSPRGEQVDSKSATGKSAPNLAPNPTPSAQSATNDPAPLVVANVPAPLPEPAPANPTPGTSAAKPLELPQTEPSPLAINIPTQSIGALPPTGKSTPKPAEPSHIRSAPIKAPGPDGTAPIITAKLSAPPVENAPTAATPHTQEQQKKTDGSESDRQAGQPILTNGGTPLPDTRIASASDSTAQVAMPTALDLHLHEKRVPEETDGHDDSNDTFRMPAAPTVEPTAAAAKHDGVGLSQLKSAAETPASQTPASQNQYAAPTAPATNASGTAEKSQSEPAPPVAHLEPVLPEKQTPTQPLRAFSLEFTPDGAKDVRLHVSQHGGDVHVALRSSDDTLSGKLRDGVQDLVGNLSNAGYETDSWSSPGEGQRRQQQEPETPHPARKGNGDDAAFEEMIQTQSKENL